MQHVIVGTAGHIDHGKSTLVRALTGIDPDRLKEEKARGITIDLGFAHDVRGDVTLAFVDVPGHERFVKNMLAGATGIDVLLLVVAADESVMPQTREHFEICRLLRVPSGVVALTKADLVDEDTLELVRLEVRDLVAGSFLAEAPILPVSARSGAGLERLRAALLAASAATPHRRADGPFRLPIDRVFSVRGFGTVVTGTVTSGRARLDEELEVLPTGRRVKVRGLQGHGAAATVVGAGQRAAVNLAGIDVADVSRGDALVSPSAFAQARRLDARLELLPSARPLKHGARVRFHHGTAETLGRLAISAVHDVLDADGSPVSGEIPPGHVAWVRFRLERPIVVTRGDRFIVRAYSPPVTIGGGVVLDPEPQRGPIRSSAGRERFERLDGGLDAATDVAAIDRVVETLVRERGARGLERDALVRRIGLAPDAAEAATRRGALGGSLAVIGDLLVARDALDRLSAALRALVADYHRANPLSDGMPREEARERLFARAHPAVFEAVLDRLVRDGAIVARDRLALATHKVTLTPEEDLARARVEAAFQQAGLRPPDTAALAGELGLSAAAVERALTVLQRQRVLVRLDTIWFHAEALERLKREVRALKDASAAARVDVSSFKDRYGVSRKYAIPLLEFLDRERVTRRVGDSRVVL